MPILKQLLIIKYINLKKKSSLVGSFQIKMVILFARRIKLKMDAIE